MKTGWFKILSSYILALVLFTGCTKEMHTINREEALQIHTSDHIFFTNSIDEIAHDIIRVAESHQSISGRPDVLGLTISNAIFSIDSSQAQKNKITVRYLGSQYTDNKSRSGTVVVELNKATKWSLPGATLHITFQNILTRKHDTNSSLLLNGTISISNIYGGMISQLAAHNNLTLAFSSGLLTVRFDQYPQRDWSVSKYQKYSLDGGLVAQESGLYYNETSAGISEKGKNRFGQSFTSQITNPLYKRLECGFRISEGEIIHSAPQVSAKATYGLDINGLPTSCPGAGNYYLLMEWLRHAISGQPILLRY